MRIGKLKLRLKVVRSRRDNVDYGEQLSRRFGLAYQSCTCDKAVYYLVPFNLIVRWSRNLWYWLAYQGNCRREELQNAAYQKGYSDGNSEAASVWARRITEEDMESLKDEIEICQI